MFLIELWSNLYKYQNFCAPICKKIENFYFCRLGRKQKWQALIGYKASCIDTENFHYENQTKQVEEELIGSFHVKSTKKNNFWTLTSQISIIFGL